MANRVICTQVAGATRRLGRLRWHALALSVGVGLIVPAGVRAAIPYASTLNDLCPGTPDPCVVTGKFLVSNGTTFDLGGRALTLSSTAALIADSGASFWITNAASVALENGSVLTAPGKGIDAGGIAIGALGACSLSGKIQANATRDSGTDLGVYGGTVAVHCLQGIDLGKSAVIEAIGAGTLTHTGDGGKVFLNTTGPARKPFTAATGAKINVQSKAAAGGSVVVTSDADCTLGATIYADASTITDKATGGFSGGVGGGLDLDCTGNIILSKDATIVVGSKKKSEAGPVNISARGRCSVTAQKCLGDDDCPNAGEVCVSSAHCTLTQSTSCSSDAECPAGEMCVQVQLDQKLLKNYGLGPNQVTVDTAGPLEIGGKLYSGATNGNAAALYIDVYSGGFTLGSKGVVKSNAAGGTGGEVSIIADSGPCNLSGKIYTRGSSNKIDSGTGGNVVVECYQHLNVHKAAVIDTSASGKSSAGGSLQLQSGWSGVTIDGKLIANGVSGGGVISLEGIGITTTADSSVSANGLTGGSVDVVSTTDVGGTIGSVLIQKNVSAKGSGKNSTGGAVTIEACNVTIDTKGAVSTDGTTGGTNSLTAHKKLTIDGHLSAKPSGTNTLVFRDDVSILPQYIVPASTPTQNLALSACP